MNGDEHIFIFRLEHTRFAIPLSAVKRVERMVQLSDLPSGLEAVRGVINWHGQAIAVFDLRTRLGLSPSELSPSQSLVIVDLRERLAALVADEIEGPMDPESLVEEEATAVFSEVRGIERIAHVGKNIVFVYDVSAFLTEEENAGLAAALKAFAA